MSEATPITICAHCRSLVVGFAGVGNRTVCHPDFGIDCYRLVTVYDHPMPCGPCSDVRLLMNNQVREGAFLDRITGWNR